MTDEHVGPYKRLLKALNDVVPEYGDIVKITVATIIIFMFMWGEWLPDTSFEASLGLMGGSVALTCLWVWLHIARRRYAKQEADEQLNSSSLDEINAQR